MTPQDARARLLADLTAERFPDPDALLVESRLPDPSILRAAELELAALEPDSPEVLAYRRAVLEAMPSDHQLRLRSARKAHPGALPENLRGVA